MALFKVKSLLKSGPRESLTIGVRVTRIGGIFLDFMTYWLAKLLAVGPTYSEAAP